MERPPLSELARGKKSACILICDITRPVPNGTLLPPLIDTLTRAGVPRTGITILVATGLHRPNEGEELREIVGSDEIFGTVRIENHFARDRAAHVDLGRTTSGIPIMIDRRFAEADLKIVTGLVEPHFMAGYSGGRKVVAPGVAYQDTILNFHTSRILEHCNAANCIIEGNPLHNEQAEIVRTIGGIVSLNVVIDEERRIGFVNFGEIDASHLEAVAFMRNHAEVAVPRRFKTILTTSAGYPLDKTYYQTVKGMVGVIDILEPGGTIIIASECSEGMGSKEFVAAQQLLCKVGPDEFMRDSGRTRQGPGGRMADRDASQGIAGGKDPALHHGLELGGLEGYLCGGCTFPGGGGLAVGCGPRRQRDRRGPRRPLRDPAFKRS